MYAKYSSNTRAADEELEESPLRDLHQACQAAHASKSDTDMHTVSDWDGFQDNLQSLAHEVQHAAPAGLFPADLNEAPTPDKQYRQLQCIAQVCGNSALLCCLLHILHLHVCQDCYLIPGRCTSYLLTAVHSKYHAGLVGAG